MPISKQVMRLIRKDTLGLSFNDEGTEDNERTVQGEIDLSLEYDEEILAQ